MSRIKPNCPTHFTSLIKPSSEGSCGLNLSKPYLKILAIWSDAVIPRAMKRRMYKKDFLLKFLNKK
jgi:hypothetical protein